MDPFDGSQIQRAGKRTFRRMRPFDSAQAAPTKGLFPGNTHLNPVEEHRNTLKQVWGAPEVPLSEKSPRGRGDVG